MCQTLLKPGASASFITSWAFQFIFNHISSFQDFFFFFLGSWKCEVCKGAAGGSQAV